LERAAAEIGMPYRAVTTIEEAVRSASVGTERALGRSNPASLTLSVHNDLTAINLITALRAAGLTPGADVDVVSYDDTHMAAVPEFSLTSVSQDSPALASRSVELLVSHLENPGRRGKEVVIEPSLTIRASG
ncbi:MAG: substrate-binding domain-containing protein, partial [Propionibacteriaceae bacterium]|nr:substrate-binding domain-containing protein [Propionibacteriaceae bacterium]